MGVFSLFSKKPQDDGAGDSAEPPVKARRSARAAKPQDGEASDLMLPEKKRARRRLVGAIALVLAAIIGLPMIFDSEPKPLDDDIDIQIPSRDKPASVAARTVPLSPEPAPTDARPEPPADAKPDMPAEPAGVKSAPVANPVPAPAEKMPVPPAKAAIPAPAPADNSSIARAPAAMEKPVEKIIDKSAGKPTDKPADKIAEKIAEKSAEKSADKSSEKPLDKSSAKTGTDEGNFAVQVAAVSSQAKADELQNRLKKAGIQSYSLKVSTKDGDRFRIRIGPMRSRGEAERMRTRLAALGLSGTVQSE